MGFIKMILLLFQKITQMFRPLPNKKRVQATSEPQQNTVTQEVPKVDTKVDTKEPEQKPISNSPITLNNSRDFSYFTQRNNEVWPTASCNVTAMTMGLLYNKLIYQKDGKWYNRNGVDIYELNKDNLPRIPYKQFEDNLLWYLNHNTNVLAKYQQTYPNLYNDWVNECDQLEKKGIKFEQYTLKSYPPNELHLVLAFGVSKFIGIDKAVSYDTQGVETIIRRIKNGESVVVSGLFEGLNHIVCIVGVQYESNTGKVIKFLIDDPWYKTLDYKSKKTGDDSMITYDDFIKYVKPLDNKEKACHIFATR